MLDFSRGVAPKCLIRIGSPIEIMQEFYSQKLLAYSRTHPTVSFEVVPEAGPDALMNDEADILVVNKKLTDETNFVVRPFYKTSTPVLCSPEYLRRYGLPALWTISRNTRDCFLKPKLIFSHPIPL